MHESREIALRKAEERARISRVMGPAGGQRLGGTMSAEELARLKNRPPGLIAAEAAERRARETKGCTHDDGEAEREARKAAEESEVIVIDDDDDIAQTASQAADAVAPADEIDQKPDTAEKPLFAPDDEDSDDSDCMIVEPPPGYVPPPRKAPGAGPSKRVIVKRAPTIAPQPAPTLRLGPSSPVAPTASTSKRPASSPPPVERPPNRARPSHEPFSWPCPRCTFANTAEYGLACELCAYERPSTAWPEPDAANPSALRPDRVTVTVTARGADGREVTRTSTRIIGRTPAVLASLDPAKRVHTHFDDEGWCVGATSTELSPSPGFARPARSRSADRPLKLF